MRVALITDGAYPYRHSVAATWCHRIVRSLPEHGFDIIAITNEPAVAAYAPPTNVTSFATLATDGRPAGSKWGRAAFRRRRLATQAAVLLCRSIMSDTPHSLAMFRSSLRRLAILGADGTHPLHGVSLAAVLLDAWRVACGDAPRQQAHIATQTAVPSWLRGVIGVDRATAAGAGEPADADGSSEPADADGGSTPEWLAATLALFPPQAAGVTESAGVAWTAGVRQTAGGAQTAGIAQPVLPEPTRDDLECVAGVLEQAMRVLAASLPSTDINHATDASLATLAAIVAKWRFGTPFVLTEHETYVDAGLLAATASRPAARAVALRFLRVLARLGYQEAARVAVPTEQLRRWALDHGADPATVCVVGYGVDPHSYPRLRYEPAEPVITFLGPERDALTMLDALPKLRAKRRGVRLKMSGWQITHPAQVTPAEVQFLGPVNHRRSAYAAGQVVVVSARWSAAPYAVIEAMMSGRPTVCMDDGRLASIIGSAGAVVPYDDRDALADACLALLGSPDRRRALSVAGGQRARNLFGLRATIDSVRTTYEEVARDSTDTTVSMPSLRSDLGGDAEDLVDDLLRDLGLGDSAVHETVPTVTPPAIEPTAVGARARGGKHSVAVRGTATYTVAMHRTGVNDGGGRQRHRRQSDSLPR